MKYRLRGTVGRFHLRKILKRPLEVPKLKETLKRMLLQAWAIVLVAAALENLERRLEETPEISEITRKLPDIRRANLCRT